MKTIDVIKVMLREGMSVSTQPINEQLGKFFTDVAVKATVDAARLELKNLVSTIVNSGKGLTRAAIVGSRVYLETLEKLSQAAAKQSGHKNWAAFAKADPAGAKIAMTEVTKGMNEELLGAAKGMNKPIEGGLALVKDDAKAVTNKIGKSTPAEIDAALKNVQSNSKLSTNLQKARGEITKLKPQTLKQFESSMAKLAKMKQGNGATIGGGLKKPVTGVKGGKAWVFKPSDLLKYPGKVVQYTFSGSGLKTILGIVGGAAIIYAIYQMLNPDALVIVTDENGNDIQDGGAGSWAPCIQELLTSKEGVIGSDGSVIVKPTDFPGGLQFYNNGRVMDVAGKKMGTWKCKGTTPVIAESQKIKLSGLLNEQGDATTATDVNTMINLLDFPVSGGDLVAAGNLLQKYVNNGKGKDFLSLYQQSGLGGGDLTKTLNYIYTSEPQSVQAKNRLKQLNAQILSGKGGGAAPTPGVKKGLGGIDIIWDGEKKDDGKNDSTKTKKKSGVNYHDCSTKEPGAPLEFGCISPKIAEMQGCLGITPQKGYFGPKTRKALTDMFGEKSVDGGITKDIYDKVMASCAEAKVDDRKKYSPEELKTIPIQKIQQTTGLKAGDMKLPNITPLADTNKGERLYKIFQGNYETRNQEGNENDSYLFQEGNRIKYKGDALSQENLDVLSGYISGLGFDFMKAKPKDDYEFKYVWLKR
jgi:hypothetical protein